MKTNQNVCADAQSATPFTVSADTVYVRTNITPPQTDGESWRFDETQHTKDEYIALLSEKNTALEAQLSDTQMALCELYETIAETR